MQLEAHPSDRFDIQVKPMLFRIRIESREVLSLLLCQVEVRVGEGCSHTLTLPGKEIISTQSNDILHRGDPGFHQCIPE